MPNLAVAETKNLNDWILEKTGAGSLRISPSGVVESMSGRAAAILGAGQSAIGRNLADILPVTPYDRVAALLAGEISEWPVPGEALRPFQVCPAYRLVARGADAGMEFIVFDRSELARQEAEAVQLKATTAASQELLRRKNQELDSSLERMASMNEKLAALDDLKSQFLSNTSHELRTPLNTIIGSMQLVREGLCENREEELEYFDSALEAAQRLLKVINEMLDSAKLSAGKMNFLIADHPASDLFDEAYSQMTPQARAKGLNLEFSPPPSGLTFHADFEKARQSLLNIVANAIKFTDAGGIVVTAAPDATCPDEVRFSVKDTGIGVPAELQGEIFEKFTQEHGGSTRRHSGTGLGLAITRNLIEMMGGSIGIVSEGRDLGTEVFFTLPRGMRDQLADGGAEIRDEDFEKHLPMTF